MVISFTVTYCTFGDCTGTDWYSVSLNNTHIMLSLKKVLQTQAVWLFLIVDIWHQVNQLSFVGSLVALQALTGYL